MSAIKARELAKLRVLREEFAQLAADRTRHKRARERAHEIAERQSAMQEWVYGATPLPTGSQRPLNF